MLATRLQTAGSGSHATMPRQTTAKVTDDCLGMTLPRTVSEHDGGRRIRILIDYFSTRVDRLHDWTLDVATRSRSPRTINRAKQILRRFYSFWAVSVKFLRPEPQFYWMLTAGVGYATQPMLVSRIPQCKIPTKQMPTAWKLKGVVIVTSHKASAA